jgi:hypothetical protein
MTDLSWGASAADGARAAVALVGSRVQALTVPIEGYGSICSSRPLTAAEATSFLTQARRSVGARRLSFTTVDFGAAGADLSFARQILTASVVDADGTPASRYARLTRRSIRRAETAGCSVRTTDDGEAFLGLYERASAQWAMRYPAALILELGRGGVARFDEVLLGGRVVSALLTLRGKDHWMCWLAAQADEGREVAASYLAYDRVFSDASGEVRWVNLGASAPGTGGAEFKRRLGAVERPICHWSTASRPAQLNDARVRLQAAVRRRYARARNKVSA